MRATLHTYFISLIRRTLVHSSNSSKSFRTARIRAPETDSTGSATSLGSGDTGISDQTIHRKSDRDYFRFDAPATGELDVSISFANHLGNIDLFVKDSGGTEIDSSEGDSDSESVSVQMLEGETYYILVKGATGDEVQPDYDLFVNFKAPPTISDIGERAYAGWRAG